MSVYKDKRSPFYQYDFWRGGYRFFGSTGKRSQREAQQIEDQKKEEARDRVKKLKAAKDGPLTLDFAAGRYWSEWGQHQSNAKDLKRDIARLIDYFGKDRLLADITDDEVAKLVAWRRGHRRWGRPKERLITPSQVNRSTTEVLQRIFMRARKVWRKPVEIEPDWNQHLLAEPVERVRELRVDEDSALAGKLDPDYEALRQFSLASGLRQSESLLRWSQVDFAGRAIVRTGKGGRPIRLPMTARMREILMGRSGHHQIFVFTYQAKRAGRKRARGQRMPITQSGLKTHWRRRRVKAGVSNFRWHDNRHDFATKLLRSTGNLKMVQRGLNHARIETTAKYAHVLDEDLRAGMESADEARSGKSRNASRTEKKDVA